MQKKRTLTFAVSIIVAVGALLVAPVASPAYAASSADRVAGADRYGTAAAASRAAFADPSRVDTVFIAAGSTYPDSLSAGPIAAHQNAPVLLTHHNGLPWATTAEIRRLAPEKIVIIGGSGAVPTKVGSQLKKLAPDVSRISGTDRYETSRKAAEWGFPDGAGKVYLATGSNYADAVSGGALAAANSAPIVLIDPAQPHLNEATRHTLSKIGAAKVIVIGGEAVVPPQLVREAKEVTGASGQRLGGADRYETSMLVAQQFGAVSNVLVATGYDFPDAISAIPLAAVRGVPIVLSVPYCVSATTAKITRQTSVNRLTLMGGVGALRGLVGSQHACLSTSDPNSTWLVVNKKRPLVPPTHVPGDMRGVNVRNVGGGSMRNEAAGALEQLFARASAEGAGAMANTSAYRSYSFQQGLFDNAVRRKGIAQAEIDTARPGHSEHQTGMAIDVVACGNGCGGIYQFGGTSQSGWVNDNAHRFGFIVRYEPGYQHIAGYMSEPWHLRYVGTALASDYKAGGFHTLEQYFGLPAAPNY